MDQSPDRRSSRPELPEDTPSARLAEATRAGLSFGCELASLMPLWRQARALDELDERLARRCREEFGRRAWLSSWHRVPGGSWLARLSGPGVETTIERTARSRSGAIRLATLAVSDALYARDRGAGGNGPGRHLPTTS